MVSPRQGVRVETDKVREGKDDDYAANTAGFNFLVITACGIFRPVTSIAKLERLGDAPRILENVPRCRNGALFT